MLETTEVEAMEEAEGVDEPSINPLQKRVETAFITSSKRVLGDISLPLKPYSASREVAAQAMGLHYAYVDATGQERFRRTKLYPGALRDVAILMWLCAAATDDEIDSAGIEGRPAANKAIKWAKEHELLDTTKDKFWIAFKLFFDIMDETYVTRVVVEQKKTTSEGQR